MTPISKTFAGFVAAATLAGGGVVIADQQIDPYTDTGTKLEVSAESVTPEAGTNTIELVKAQPEIRLKKWNGQIDLGVRYDKVTSAGSRALLTDRMEWKDTKEELHAYPIEKKAGQEDGGFEIDIILKEKPDTNVFNFQIDGATELDFFYQPPLNEQPPKGETCTETQCTNGDGVNISARAENVVGSYAVYHKSFKNHLTGQTNFATGKAYHIYRPKVFDANGAEVWATLNYTPGTLSITVPQDFLDKAVYPVRIDPTFGYTTLGASANTTWASGFFAIRQGSAATPAGSCNLDKITVGLQGASAGTFDVTAFVNKEQDISSSQHSQVSKIERTALSVSGTAAFYDFTAASESITAINYIVNAVGGNGGGTDLSIMYDSGSSHNTYQDFTTSYTGVRDESPWNQIVTAATTLHSIYATCSTGGGGGGSSATPRGRIIDFDAF